MGLFDRKKKEFPPLVSDHSTQTVNFNTVVEYLEGLSNEDYTKTLHVVSVYRGANAEANKILGNDNEPTTFIKEPSIELEDIEFIETPAPKTRKKAKK